MRSRTRDYQIVNLAVEPGDLATWSATVVAVGAMTVAVWQAREAKKSRGAAETQATAAAEQVKLMRTDLDDRQAPQFDVVEAIDHHQDCGYFAAKITLRMLDGPALSTVVAKPYGDVVHSVPHTFTQLRPGSTVSFIVSCEDGYIDENVVVELDCAEDGGRRRQWTRWAGATITPQPPPPPGRLFAGRWTG